MSRKTLSAVAPDATPDVAAVGTPPAPSQPVAELVADGELLRIPIDQLHESPFNPRRRFHEADLNELAASLRTHRVLTPLLARPTSNGGGPAYELAAGHRRRRAALIAELAELPVVVRPMSDVQLIEILTIENGQREDVHPLEEAQGFADLIKVGGYDVQRIADRIGRSRPYVYDRLRLLQLTDALQQVFFDGEITTGHAVLLARLSPADQARALKQHGALFTHDNGAENPELSLGDRRKAMSVGELQRWIDLHVRFNPLAEDTPELFPDTDRVVAAAREEAEKIIPITHEYHVQPEAKDGDTRTFGPTSWARADGQYGSKTCEHAVTGVIVVGPGRGEAFRVCIARKTCTTHWNREIKEATKRAKEREQGGERAASGAADRHAAERARQEAEQKRQDDRRTAFAAARPKILDAIALQLKKRGTGAGGQLGQLLIDQLKPNTPPLPKQLAPGTSAEDLVHYLALLVVARKSDEWNAIDRFPKFAKGFGVDVAKILAGDTKPRFPAKKASAKKKRARG